MGASAQFDAAARSDDATPVGVPDDVMRAIVAEELDRMREFIEDLGIRLCIDPVMVQQHSEVLQGLDELSQRNENLAAVLRASDMAGAVNRITLGTLRDRLGDALEAISMGGEKPDVWVQI